MENLRVHRQVIKLILNYRKGREREREPEREEEERERRGEKGEEKSRGFSVCRRRIVFQRMYHRAVGLVIDN